MKKNRNNRIFAAAVLMACLGITACGKNLEEEIVGETVKTQLGEEKPGVDTVGQTEEDTETNGIVAEGTGIAAETAKDGKIDFLILQKENPDIFAWIYIPGTEIDYPVLQSPIADDYYETHLVDGTEGMTGAPYTEMANLMNMCDFNTIIHGKDSAEEDLFRSLHQFENPDFFTEHSQLYLYLPDNLLTYTIYAAYYDKSSDILRRYDYTTYEGCLQYLDDFYGIREMGMNYREGWEDLTPGHFLLTLNGDTDTETDRQYVVMAALVGDAAGKIDRVFVTE